MNKTAKEIRDGLDFLLKQADKTGASVNTGADHDVFCVSLFHCLCSDGRVEAIQIRMTELGWFQDENEGDEELDFRHFI